MHQCAAAVVLLSVAVHTLSGIDPQAPPRLSRAPLDHYTERETGRSRGFGFVTMNTDEATAAATSLNNTDFM